MKKPKKKVVRKKTETLLNIQNALDIIAREYPHDMNRKRFYSVLFLALPHITTSTMAEVERLLIPALGLAVLEKHLKDISS